MSLPERVEVAAPAKVNPLLSVLGRRPDGFHELDTLLLAVELGDTLVLERADELTCVLRGPFATADVPTDDRNLAVRAARAALEQVGGGAGARLVLHKDVPSQAGLGGGSSDAAAAVAGVEALYGVDLGAEARAALLAGLGSDCLFFDAARETGCARATGRGEVLEVLPAPEGLDGEWWVAIVTPEERCPTAEVYGALGGAFESSLSPPPQVPTVRALVEMRASEARGHLHNGLEAAALAVRPGLLRWRDCFEAAGEGHFRLSGSGSSFFGLYDTAGLASEGLVRVLAEARRRELAVRGRWVTRSCGHGSRTRCDRSREGA